jgi:hypothetical protein
VIWDRKSRAHLIKSLVPSELTNASAIIDSIAFKSLNFYLSVVIETQTDFAVSKGGIRRTGDEVLGMSTEPDPSHFVLSSPFCCFCSQDRFKSTEDRQVLRKAINIRRTRYTIG